MITVTGLLGIIFCILTINLDYVNAKMYANARYAISGFTHALIAKCKWKNDETTINVVTWLFKE